MFIEPGAEGLADHPALVPRDGLPRRHLIATADARDWIMTRFTTASGPLDIHHFTAMRDEERDWGGCAAPPLDAQSSPFDYARRFVLKLLDHPTPPRA